MKTPQDILEFWFADRVQKKWFEKDPAFDEEVRRTFLSTYEDGEKPEWQTTPASSLAHIILFDQFPRNMFRDTPQAFVTDSLARKLASAAISKKFDRELIPQRRHFLYMPFMHSESKEDQAYSLELFTSLGNKNVIRFAEQHKNIIDRFGRFPHRNKILGRESTPEEKQFLTQPGSSF